MVFKRLSGKVLFRIVGSTVLQIIVGITVLAVQHHFYRGSWQWNEVANLEWFSEVSSGVSLTTSTVVLNIQYLKDAERTG